MHVVVDPMHEFVAALLVGNFQLDVEGYKRRMQNRPVIAA
jgi:hypothetical protein